jgi:hypothetical protein
MCVFCWDLLKDYVLKLMVSVCVLLEFIERLYAVIDGFSCVCSARILLKDYVLKLMVSMCVLLELSDNVYAGVVTACVVCVHAKMCVVQRNCDSLPKLCRLQRISIRCRN